MPSAEIQAVVAMFKDSGFDLDIPILDQRARMAAMATPPPEGATCTPLSAGGVPCEWVVAAGADESRAVLYLHGGGYCIGSVDSHRGLGCELSRTIGVAVLMVDYRLAPEHPFPAAVDDAVAAYRWLLDSRGLAPSSVVVAGDSAGGGLTVSTLVAVRDAGLGLPAAGVCMSPWTDLSLTSESVASRGDRDIMCTHKGLTQMAEAYLAGTDVAAPLASPVHADLSGLPPLLIHVGSEEILADDASELAARASDAGVEVTLREWEGMIHVFQIFFPLVPESREAVDEIAAFARRHLGL